MKPVTRKFQTLMVCAALMCVAKLSARADEAAGKPAAGHPPAETAPAAEAPALAKDWSVTVAADWFSEYIFRGVDLLANDPVFVPSLVAKQLGATTSTPTSASTGTSMSSMAGTASLVSATPTT